MISIKMITVFIAVLVISHNCIMTMAQESPGFGSPPGGPRRPGGPPDDSPGPRGAPDSPVSNSGPPSSSSSEGSGDDNENNGQRLFFSTLFSSQRVSCDYSTQAGASCLNCQQRLVCTRRGGHLTTCRGLLQHCTDGRCSFRQSDVCAAATAATTTAAATTTQAATTTAPATTTMAG